MSKPWFKYMRRLYRLCLFSRYHITELTGVDFSRFEPVYIDTLKIRRKQNDK